MRRLHRACAGMFAAVLLTLPMAAAAETIAVDSPLLVLQETIRHQQEQLRQQAEQVRLQSQQLEALQQQINALLQAAQLPPAAMAVAVPAPEPVTAPAAVSPPVVSAGSNRIKLAISGQVNRALNLINDGAGTKLYHVDNTASNSRFRLVGTAALSNGLTLGSRLEVAVSPDASSRVSQTQQTPGTFFNQRWAELYLESSSYGKLSIGKGDTASKGSAVQDLSRTDVVQFAGVSFVAGGMLFRKADDVHELTAIRVIDAFRNRDGLGRQSRLRYDSPRLFGFSLAGSIASNQSADLGLYWGGEGYGFRAVGAAAVSNPRLDDSGLLYDGSFSLLHTASGLNLTVSGGLLERAARKDATNLYVKLGWLANITQWGYTAFGVDYTNSGNMPASDDRGYSVGAAVVQSFEKYATELYLQYRIYSLKQGSGMLLDDIQVSTMGVRVKF